MTMQVIQHIELGSAAASIEFATIPTDGTDLYLTICGRNSNAVNDNEIVQLRFNNDSGSNYSQRTLLGTGSSAVSQSGTLTYINAARCPSDGRTSNTFSNIGVYIPNYRSSSAKSVSVDGVEENNGTTAIQAIIANLWTGTAGISTITLNFGAGNFMAGSSATLYKITKGSDGTTTVS